MNAPPHPAHGRPERIVTAGRYIRLEPIGQQHAADLFAASSVPDAEQRFRYLFATLPPVDLAEMRQWVTQNEGREDRVYFAVVEVASGHCLGRQALMSIVPEHGVIEIGAVYWGPQMARTRLATEALYLSAKHVFEDLGYRRFEWRCNNHNEPSKAAAQRFGFQFEGIFRQHMIDRGENRDTAWFAMLDGDWPRLKAEYERWLEPSNFDADGIQKSKLRLAS
jgi:RimJ/RimL family protein N-acetyltransferase